MNRIFSIVCVLFVISYGTSCMPIGQVSSHSFTIATNRGGRTPAPATVGKDIEAFAIGRGFRPVDLLPELAARSAYKSYVYALDVSSSNGERAKNKPLLLHFGFLATSTAVLVGLDGPNNAANQRAADEFAASFKEKFGPKYGYGSITE